MRETRSSSEPHTSGCGPAPRQAAVALAVWAAVMTGLAGCEVTSLTARRGAPARIDSVPSALAGLRDSRDPLVRRGALEYLGDPSHLGSGDGRRDDVAEVLTLALSAEADPHLRITIVRSLARLGSPKAAAGMLEAAGDRDAAVRVAAATALGAAGVAGATERLDKLLLTDPSRDVRLAAADALGNIRSREAAVSLLSGLEDSDIALRHRCRDSLKRITGRDHAADVARWTEEVRTAGFEEAPRQPRKFSVF